MPLLSTPAIVLASMKLGEADKLVTFFTQKKGKLKGIAQGARRMKNRFGAAIEPFSHINLILFEKGGEKLSRVNQTDIIHSFQPLRESLETIKRASHMAHLIQKMTPQEEPNAAIYQLLHEGFTFLERGLNPPLSSLLFMMKLTYYSGYQPRWNHCLKCKSSSSQGRTYFSSADGGTLCAKCADGSSRLVSISAGALAFLRATQQINYKIAHRFKPTLTIYQEIETLFRNYLAHTTGSPLPKLIREDFAESVFSR